MADGRNLEKVKELAAYRVSEEMYVEEMDSRAMVLEHIKSGARIFLMSNEDENKVFYIGFRTPPDDSTGLPHILEHSVLEGSDKFPVKDPFVELVKGSLNTFLNAMTYPDKTVYPVASCNDKDFQNLMDVYLDGVLHPAIYTAFCSDSSSRSDFKNSASVNCSSANTARYSCPLLLRLCTESTST